MAVKNTMDENTVTLCGRVSAEPETRILPSQDELVTFRLIVTRPPRRGQDARTHVDVIDIACWSAATRRAALRLEPDTTVRVEGALRRRFFQTGGGAASRYEVEATSIRRS
ncbi:MAG: single-stranded DNA-binding protein [Actinomycetia bacterium]|nr:single-stranded DNA-binding protein [Actinomycetes bacterium]